MTTLTQPARTLQTVSPSDRLRTSMAAARVSFTWLGVRKSHSSSQKDQAANHFGAETKFLSAGKKLIDTSHPAFKAVTNVRSQTIAYWKEVSLPFPEPGIRLIRLDAIEEFNRKMAIYQVQLEHAVRTLDQHYEELRNAARERFAIEHDFPSVEPPQYLQHFSPEMYRQECQRVQSRFDEAVQLAEQAFMEELSRLVEHLTERLSGQDDGKPKVFRDSAIANLTEFFERFRSLNVRSNEQLDELVLSAQRIVQGIEPQQLRDNQWLRQSITTRMTAVQAGLDQLLVDRPRRNIQRRTR